MILIRVRITEVYAHTRHHYNIYMVGDRWKVAIRVVVKGNQLYGCWWTGSRICMWGPLLILILCHKYNILYVRTRINRIIHSR